MGLHFWNWLFGFMGPLLCDSSGPSGILAPLIGLRTFSPSEDNTTLSPTPARLRPTPWELTYYFRISSGARPAERRLFPDFHSFGRPFKCPVDFSLAKLSKINLRNLGKILFQLVSRMTVSLPFSTAREQLTIVGFLTRHHTTRSVLGLDDDDASIATC